MKAANSIVCFAFVALCCSLCVLSAVIEKNKNATPAPKLETTSAPKELKVHTCPGRQLATIESLTISSCNAYPCVFKRGTAPVIKMKLKARSRITDLQLKITGLIMGKPVPFPTDAKDHCASATKQTCPIKRGADFEYEFSLEVQEAYPTISLNVQYELVDKSQKTVACFVFPLKIE